ncbi:MAG TPA: isochorismatase family cysteine hydrolase [Dissulfurispiraceae bacterium]|nr:isochorismatase family cysteine hydrolase [Dissulfurispiraceae bacterium]
MQKEALLIIDMLNDFVLPGAPLEVADTRRIIPAIKRELAEARKEGKPVIYLCDSHDPDDKEFSRFGWPAHAVTGTDGSKVVKELEPEEDDLVIPKKTYLAFYNTELGSALKNLGVDSLVLTGCVTHICILFTAVEAVPRGYSITVPADAVAGLAKEDHEAGLRIMKNVLGARIV